MVKYDPDVIQKFAERLYKKARSIIASFVLLGVLIGAGGGFALTLALPNSSVGIALAAAGAVLVGFIGYTIGVERSFHLRLAAQTALCQMMIEANTRQAPAGGEQPSRPEIAQAA
jgi:hypothetical protein